MKTGRRANHRCLVLQRSTACQLHLLEVLDSGEMAIDEHRIGDWPEIFCRLQFGRV